MDAGYVSHGGSYHQPRCCRPRVAGLDRGLVGCMYVRMSVARKCRQGGVGGGGEVAEMRAAGGCKEPQAGVEIRAPRTRRAGSVREREGGGRIRYWRGRKQRPRQGLAGGGWWVVCGAISKHTHRERETLLRCGATTTARSVNNWTGHKTLSHTRVVGEAVGSSRVDWRTLLPRGGGGNGEGGWRLAYPQEAPPLL